MFRTIVFGLSALAAPAFADPAQIDHVHVEKSGGVYTFHVTVRHGDTGWEHYVDAWRVIGPDGAVLGTRELAHPHVNEQPFTRSLSRVSVPDGITSVTVETRDNVSGWSGNARKVNIN